MKISKSKQELARIISENGGWRDDFSFAAQDGDDFGVWFYRDKPSKGVGRRWRTTGDCECKIWHASAIQNWHQTILSRAEYFHLYPAPDADGWIAWNGGAKSPVGNGVIVDVKIRCGSEHYGQQLDDESWLDSWGDESIIAYRLHKPEQAKSEFCESVMRSIPEPTVTPTLDQLLQDWRNADDHAQRKQTEADEAAAMRDERWQAVQARAGEMGVTIRENIK